MSGPKRRQFLIIGYAYTNADIEKRDGIIGKLLSCDDAKNVRGTVVIGVNIDTNEYPYTVLAGKLSTKLFDV